MSDRSSKTLTLTGLADLLRHPLRLRLVLCPVILGGWYFLFFSPLSDDMTATLARIERERRRIDAARQVEQARKSLDVFKDRVPVNSDLNELMQFVMSRIRESPLKLIDLSPARSKATGPYDVIAFDLNLEGTYSEVHELLNWIQKERRLLRVDSLRLAPVRVLNNRNAEKGPTKLTIKLSLAGLMEKSRPEKPLGVGRR